MPNRAMDVVDHNRGIGSSGIRVDERCRNIPIALIDSEGFLTTDRGCPLVCPKLLRRRHVLAVRHRHSQTR